MNKKHLYYCETNYFTKPPQDINPILLQLFPNGLYLVICARDGMVKRINKFMATSNSFDCVIVPQGIWQLYDYINILDDYLFSFDCVIVLGRNRISPVFHHLLQKIEHCFNAKS